MSALLTIASSSIMLDLAIKSAIILLLALFCCGLLGRASAAWRHFVCCLGVTNLLLLPVLSLALPAWRVTWLPQWNGESARAVAGEPAMLPRAARSQPAAPDPMPTIVMPPPRDIDVAVPAEPIAPDTQRPSATAIEAANPRSDPLSWLAAAWAAGALLSLVPLAVGLWQLAALHRHSQRVDDPRWLMLLDELRRQFALRRKVQIRHSEQAQVPLTWGALRPVLLMPDQAVAWSDERRRLVLLHELAHVRRFDWLTQLVAQVACAMYWFNPLVWFAAKQMRIERERACDDLVLASGARASEYAQELLALAAGVSNTSVSTLVAVPMASPGTLEDRLRGILDRHRSRAALTTAAVLLVAALATVAFAPLAMLRAAPPQAAAPVPADEPAATTPAPDDTAADETEPADNGITISVRNATGDRGIPEFRVIAGVSSGGIADEYQKRTGKTVVNWQSHTCRIGTAGALVWPLDKAYAEMALRVEADGYQPQVVTGLKKAAGAQHIALLLTEDPGVAGRILTPAGQPAAGAIVALAIPSQEIVWEDGKLRGAAEPLPANPGDRWRRPHFVQTDPTGAFRLPTEVEPAAVLVVHESGVLETAYDAWTQSPEITLQRWGSITGQVLWQDKLGADEEVSLTVHRDAYGYPGMIASYARARTDEDGKFTFDRVLPGQVQISRPIAVTEPNTSRVTQAILNGMFQHLEVAPGTPASVLLGGQGRQVMGKFAGLDSWEGATYHFHPEAPHFGFGGDNVSWKAFAELKASSIGPLLFRDKQPLNPDGTFTIERMLPGRYQLFLSVPGFDNYAATAVVQVDPEAPGQAPTPLELNEITVVKQAAAPADVPAERPAAKTTTIRGKVLDDATGEPIERLITQAGKFDPADPTKITWGYSEGRSSARDGSFSTTIRWAEGWTARILADGYIPQPVITAAPPADQDEIEVVIRLKRGPTVRGVVLDHRGRPVQDAAVFAVGPTGVSLAAGHANASFGGSDDDAQPVRTGADGRFELPVGDAKSLAISHSTLDAWPTEIPAEGEVTVRLPEPARVNIELAIDGADQESLIFYQLLTAGRQEFKGVRLEREVTVTNPGMLSLAALPPGRYQLSRNVMNNLGEVGMGAMVEREFFELQAGETKNIRLVRDQGARVRGKATWPADTKLMGSIISVRSLLDQKSPFDQHEWPIIYASHTAAQDGTFETERILPGKYRLQAAAYVPLTPDQRFRSGFIRPAFRAEVTIDVPAEGELHVDDLILRPSQAGE